MAAAAPARRDPLWAVVRPTPLVLFILLVATFSGPWIYALRKAML